MLRVTTHFEDEKPVISFEELGAVPLPMVQSVMEYLYTGTCKFDWSQRQYFEAVMPILELLKRCCRWQVL